MVKSDIQKYVSPLRRTQRPECLAIGRFWVITEDVSVAHPNASIVGMAFPGTFFAGPTGPGQTAFLRRVLSRTEYKRQSLLLLNPGNGPAPVAGTKISSEHLDLITYRPDSGRAPGNRFALVFEVKPGPGIHVYAPGASGYRVVSLAIIRQPIVRVLPIKYPASEIYFFRPLANEVPVYQKPFTLVQEVILEGTQKPKQHFVEQRI